MAEVTEELFRNKVFGEFMVYVIKRWRELESIANSEGRPNDRIRALDKKAVFQEIFTFIEEKIKGREDD